MVPAAGLNFYALQRGETPRTLFIHGFGGDLHTWDRVFSYLDPDLAALRYDLRGFGRTPCPDSIPFRHSDDLLALLDSLAILQCDLVGVSMGGSVALNFALNHPQRVRSLVLISPGLMGWEWSEVWQRQWAKIVATARAGKMDRARQLFYSHPLFFSTRASDAADDLYDSIMRYSGQEWLQNFEQPSLPDVDRLLELKRPTLLLSGGCDLSDFQVIADLLSACVENIQRIDFPELGHLIHLEDPQACAQSVQTFLHQQQTVHQH
ncbi:alpha/beta fold hydrolase [Pseudomaricurvus hydrocarbonicus]|nr:alpha/beta hydrolase [Aestuariicella hydrocarbonica]